jgi:hypothetical protein
LRDVNTICRRSWYIAAHVWKIYDFKIEVVPFIINVSTELTTVWTIQSNWQYWAHKTKINETKNTTQYVLDTTLHKQTHIT